MLGRRSKSAVIERSVAETSSRAVEKAAETVSELAERAVVAAREAQRVATPALRVATFSGEMMTEGIKRHVIQGVSVPVYGVSKTVADCFRFRNRIGVNIAVEALRDAWRNKKATSEELWHYAKVCRVLNVMRPYFDSLA